jgi:hypothetical protein
MQAWSSGEHDGVERLVESLYAQSLASAKRAVEDPDFRVFLEERIATVGS